ncbi:MAG TPA: HD domain-containing protein, partial [Polyangiaceae bacterium LLY-WYZ-15_(1-7)]|nr:HD domain-containing protein [Polyangiaceae bacterium LLY-WYZ-15_(1-7)]
MSTPAPTDLASLRAALEADPDLIALREVLRHHLAEDPQGEDPGHDEAHCMRVALWTLRLAPEVPARLAIAAALLHDVVNLPKDDPARHEASTRSAKVARAALEERGFDAADVTLVCDAIRDHSFSRGATPATALGRAIQDADR